MDQAQLRNLVESLLFVADEPLTVAQLARLLEAERPAVEEALHWLAVDCQQRGLRLQQCDGAVQLVTAPEAAPYVERLVGSGAERRLSAAALETLAIVAYRQPVTRAAIEKVRGVNSDRAVRTLLNCGLVAEVGRLPGVGRPALIGTTFEFLQYFGLESLAQLPLLPESVQPGADAPTRAASPARRP